MAAVELIAQDNAVSRVERLAGELGLSMRGLQRLFAEYVGIGPKWVIRRYRLHEVTARTAAGGAIDWAVLAAELGYADQATSSATSRACSASHQPGTSSGINPPRRLYELRP